MATIPVKQEIKVIESNLVDNRDDYVPTSRYKNARYYQRDIPGIGKRVEPETWQPPDIAESVDDLFVEVRSGEEGRLGIISERVYRVASLWWVIAYVNNIVDPFEEVTVGRVLRYPTFDRVTSLVLA